jgi:hypothetical protein
MTTRWKVIPGEKRRLAETDEEINWILESSHDLESQVNTNIPEEVQVMFAARFTNPVSSRPMIGANFGPKPTLAPRLAAPAAASSAADVIELDDDGNPM